MKNSDLNKFLDVFKSAISDREGIISVKGVEGTCDRVVNFLDLVQDGDRKWSTDFCDQDFVDMMESGRLNFNYKFQVNGVNLALQRDGDYLQLCYRG